MRPTLNESLNKWRDIAHTGARRCRQPSRCCNITLSIVVSLPIALYSVPAIAASAALSIKAPSIVLFAPRGAELDQLTDRDIAIQDFLAYWIVIEQRLRREFP